MKIVECISCGEIGEHHGHQLCKICYRKKYAKDNAEKVKESYRNYTYAHGGKSMSENKECPMFLGCHVAERVLSKVFKNVKQMPTDNAGYDFVCAKDYKVDVKSSVLRHHNRSLGYWSFLIKKNTIADYFLFLVFDNREELTPMHVWLIPGEKLNHLTSTSIAKTTLAKWSQYELDVGKVVECCNTMKG